MLPPSASSIRGKRVLLPLLTLSLSGCNEVATAIGWMMVAGFLFGCVLFLLALLVMAVLPLVRKPATDEVPDFRAPSGPSSLGIGSLVLSGMVTWVVFIPLGYTGVRASLDIIALVMFLCAVVLHVITLGVALFTHTRVARDEDDARDKKQIQRLGIGAALLYALTMLSIGLWPWLAT